MNRKTFVLCLFLITILAAPVFPLMLRLSLEKLTTNADLIATGKVVEKECRWGERGKWIYTYVTVSVNEYVKGEGASTVVVRHLGGEVGRKGLIVGNMPSFRAGEEVLLFLRETEQALPLRAGETLSEPEQAGTSQIYEVSGLAQGKYEILVDENGEQVVRNNFSDIFIKDAGSMKILNEKVLSGKPLSEFVTEIKEILEEGEK